jgi:ABC-type dipeptide/oligopeptide/nickel transport system ATPase component
MRFKQTKIQALKFNQRMEAEPTFENCFKPEFNLTKDWVDEVKTRTSGDLKHHVVLFIFGETGSFKSSIAQEIATQFDKSFDVKNIAFDNNNLLKLAFSSEPKQWFIRDESPFEFGVGSWRVEKQVQILAETLRQRQNSLVFIAPTLRPVLSAHYVLETIDISTDSKVVRAGLIDPQSFKYIGFILVKIHWGNKLWEEYQKVKAQFLEQVVKMDFGDANIEQDAMRLLQDKRLVNCKNKKELIVLAREVFKSSRTGTETDYIVTKALQILRLQGLNIREQEEKK